MRLKDEEILLNAYLEDTASRQANFALNIILNAEYQEKKQHV